VLGIAAAASVVAGCGGSTRSTGSGASTSSTVHESSSAPSTRATAPPTTAATAMGFLADMTRRALHQYVATYAYSVTGAPPQTETYVQQGVKTMTEIVGGANPTITIDNGATSYLCDRAAQWHCTSSTDTATTAPGSSPSAGDLVAQMKSAVGGHAQTSFRTTHGFSMLCVHANNAGLDETYCITDQAVVGYSSIDAGGQVTTSSLVKVTAVVPPNAFDPPAVATPMG
jgi:hypothetical protein